MLSAIAAMAQITPVQQNGLWGFVKENGKFAIKPKYEEIGKPQSLNNFLIYPVKKKDLWGFVGQDGKEIIKPQYQTVTTFKNFNGDVASLVSKKGQYFYINAKGKKVGTVPINIVEIFDVGVYTIGVDDKDRLTILFGKGDIDQWRINKQFTYEDIQYFELPDTTILRSNVTKTCFGLEGFIDNHKTIAAVYAPEDGNLMLMDVKGTGNIIPTPAFHNYIFFTHDYLKLICNDGNISFFSIKDKDVLFTTDKRITAIFQNTKILEYTEQNDTTKVGLMSTEGTILTQPEYSEIIFGQSGNLLVVKDGKAGVLSQSMELLIPIKYAPLYDWGENRYFLSDGKTIGIYNAATKSWQLPMGKYTHLGKTLWKGKAYWIQKGDKWGVILPDFSREVVPPLYTESEISEGFTTSVDVKNFTVHIKKNGTVSVIDYYGKTIIPLGRYTGIKGYDNDFICVKNGNKVGLFDAKNKKQIVPPIHDTIDAGGNGKIIASNNTDTGFECYVYTANGRLAEKQAFSRSQPYRMSNFITNWLGRYPYQFNFSY